MKRGFSMIELVLAIVIIAISIASLPRIVSSSLGSNSFILSQQEAVLQSKALMGKVMIRPFDSTHIAANCRTKSIADTANCNNAPFWRNMARNFERETAGALLFVNNFKTTEWSAPIFNYAEAPGVYYDASGVVTDGELSRSFGDRSAGGVNVAIPSSNSPDFLKNSFGLNPDMNDIDDFSGPSGNFIGNFQGNNSDSIFRLNFATTVTYFDDKDFINPTAKTIKADLNTAATGGDRKNTITNIKFVEITTTLQDDIDAGLPEDQRRRVILKSFAANVGTPNVYKKEWK